jgi:hypothetical protein
MKKLIVFALVGGLCTLTAQAQFKQNAGAKAIEVQFNPVVGGPLIDINGLVYRNFMTETKAFRFGADLAFSTAKTNNNRLNGTDSLFDKAMAYGINLRPGFENHWSGTERLSPYFGAELDLLYTASKLTEEYSDGSAVKEVKTNSIDPVNNPDRIFAGINALAGFNYYFTKSIYLGVEAKIGAGYEIIAKRETKSDYSPIANNKLASSVSGFNLGTNATSTLRLGWLFGR